MVWTEIKETLRNELTDNVYDLWIEPLEFQRVDENVMYIACPDRYFGAFVTQNYLASIQEWVDKLSPSPLKVRLCDKGVKITPRVTAAATQMRLPHIPKNTSKVRSLHPRYTFDEFMVGDSNILAQSACQSMSMADDSLGPCLYINSKTGLGKSHLTHAVAHRVLAESPMTRLHYMTAQQFSSEMVQGIKTNSMDAFKRKYHDQCDILLVEDVHALKGKKKTQEELNELLDNLIKSGKKVILTANSAPRDLAGIDNEFRSRMASGLVTSINAPDFTTRYRIVHNKAKQLKLALGKEYMTYIAQHIKGDVRQVESAIIAIRAKTQLNGGRVDGNVVQEVVESVVGIPQVLNTAMISELVGSQFKVSVEAMQSRTRKKIISFPRQVAMYLARKYTKESLASIGKEFQRDHATVLHSIKVVTNLSNRDSSVAAQLNLLSDKVKTL